MANYRSQGIWESASVNGGWRCVSPEFPPGGDCTFFFRWGSFLLSFEVQPGGVGKGRAGLTLLPETGERAACEFQIRPEDRRAQFGPGSLTRFAAPEKSLREGGSAGAIENLIGVDRPFQVRVMVKGNDKLGGCLVDAEIAGQRTLISYRPDLRVKRLSFRAEGLKLRDIRLARLKG